MQESMAEILINQQVSRYKRKEIIFKAGTRPLYVYFVNKGTVKTFKTNDDGKDFITNVYKEGDFFGHLPIFEQKNHTDTALVLDDCEISKIPREEFLGMVYNNLRVAVQFITLLSGKIDEKENQLLHMAYHTVRRRTAETLLQLLKLSNLKDKFQVVPITRDDLASMVGTATETVIRCLTEFKDAHLIEVNGREIVVLNQQGLEDIQ